MRQVKVQPLTHESFAPFGQFYSYDKPEGYALCGELHQFFPDRLTIDSNHRLGISPILVKKPEKMIVTQQEYHTTTWEVIMPVNDDMILHVAPPSAGKPLPEYTRAFLVPKNTLIKMNACVWHLAPLPANESELCAMIVLPECTYMNDCTVVELDEADQFVIEK